PIGPDAGCGRRESHGSAADLRVGGFERGASGRDPPILGGAWRRLRGTYGNDRDRDRRNRRGRVRGHDRPGQSRLRPSCDRDREGLALQTGDAERRPREIPQSHSARFESDALTTGAHEEDCVTTLISISVAGRCRSRAWACALALAFVVPLAFARPAFAQAGSGVAAIEGTVTDPDNRPVVGALVIIVSSETGYERTVYTDARGRYVASGMPVSTYVVD